MATDQEGPRALPHPQSRGLIRQLRWVHDMLRRDLAAVRELAARVADGASTAEVRGGLRDLQSRSLLFQLRANCLGYCQIVHSHHGHEDAILFPAVRQAAPQLSATVDRLEADHRVVSALLDQVEELAEDLDHQGARAAIVLALTRLSTDLLQHLEFEEEALEPVLNSWERWPEPSDRW